MNRKEKLSKELEKAYYTLKDDRNEYEIFEQLEVGRGEDNYKLTFIAKKKGGFGLLRAVIDIAQSAMYGGLEGVFWRIARTAAQQAEGPMLEPIKRTFKGYEIAMIFKRWAETIPKGYMETIGNTITLPQDDSWIAYEINPKKEIRIIIDFVKTHGYEEMKIPTQPPMEEEVSVTPPPPAEIGEIKPMAPSTAPSTPSSPPFMPIPYMQILEEMGRRTYVTGSLRNTQEGFAFDLINAFDDLKLIAPVTISINETRIPSQNIILKKGDKIVYSANISTQTPLNFRKGEKIIVEIKGPQLQPGRYTLKINTVLDQLGSLSINIEDTL